jgi:glucose/arabinose dehydrogenase
MRTITCLLFLFFSIISYTQDLDLELFAQSLSSPVNIKHAGDSNLYVAEQNGFIKIVDDNGNILTTPFLDIDDRVYDPAFFGDERGLLGLAFHPDYITNGYLYVNYINNFGDTVISRFERDANNPNLANQASEVILLNISQPAYNHNGGDMHFGADGYLYIGTGDGGFAGDPSNNSQNLNNFLGKILRIDIDNVTPPNTYSVPADNPFISNPNALDEIWAYGVRNPWKFSFDSATNDLWLADVGQNTMEEINSVALTDSGINYGWRCYEGTAPFNVASCPGNPTLESPVAVYSHSGTGRCSVTGGYRYRGSTYSNFQGLYFFADFCSNEIGYLTPNDSNWDITFNSFTGAWSAFGEDIDGELYISDLVNGNIYKLIDTSLSVDEQSINSISIYPNPIENELNIDLSSGINSNSLLFDIYDIQGKKVISTKPTEGSLQTINTSSLSNGFYILKIESENGEQSTFKFIVNR